MIYYFDRGGPYFIGFVCFMLALIGGWGFIQGYELAQAIFMLAAPLMFTAVFTVRLAYRIKDEALQGEALRKALKRRRIYNQGIGMLAIIAAAVATVYNFALSLDIILPIGAYMPAFP